MVMVEEQEIKEERKKNQKQEWKKGNRCQKTMAVAGEREEKVEEEDQEQKTRVEIEAQVKNG